MVLLSTSRSWLPDILWKTTERRNETFGLLSSGARERFTPRRLPVVIVVQTAQHGARENLSTDQGHHNTVRITNDLAYVNNKRVMW